jgi:hypothetical protein
LITLKTKRMNSEFIGLLLSLSDDLRQGRRKSFDSPSQGANYMLALPRRKAAQSLHDFDLQICICARVYSVFEFSETPSYCECALHADIPKWLRNISTTEFV